MGSEQNDTQEGGQDKDPADPTEERLTALVEQAVAKTVGPVVNAAITNQLKRLKPQEPANVEKLVADAVAKALAATQQPPAGTPADGEAGKPNKDFIDLTEKYERIEKKLAESEAKAKSIEEKARWDGARESVRKSLAAKGISGLRADALVALFESSKALRFDEDGVPKLSVTRARSKNAQPEELLWDIDPGVDDWSKSPHAAEFLPAPTTPTTRQANYGQSVNGTKRPPIQYDKPALSEQEALRRAEESLVNQGVDIAAAFRR